MKLFRQILFWTHLVTGLIAGLAIAIMSFTGVLLAFEHEIVEWAERDARRVTVPVAAQPLSLADLQVKLLEAQPELRMPAVTLLNDPAAAIAFAAGREGAFFANPYTGEIRQPASTRMHDFMHVMVDWHRFLGREGDSRPVGKLINGVCNLAFFALAVTGLYIWMPRNWSWRGVKAVALFRWNLSGRARDFNWHNSIGLWCAPILIVLTLTAVPISFRWGNDLVYQLVGEEPPVRGGPPGAAASAVAIVLPSPDARPLDADVIVAAVQEQFPRWRQITLRSGGDPQRGGPRPTDVGGSPREAGPQPLTTIVSEEGSWPRTATTTLTLNPFTGDVLKREGHDDLSTGARIRRWTRFLHTGQAVGWGGQLIAGLACLGGLFLVYTGFALSWRRFFGRKRSDSS